MYAIMIMVYILVFLLILTILVAYTLVRKKIRPLFPVPVNCWFCNHDCKVPYGNKNCWDCPNCEQYNGFTAEGDYNKPVPAQFMEEINHPIGCDKGEFLSRCQYLCDRCQRNQLLKVKQLAAFEPLNEAAYDDEMAFYQRHLDKVYALCPSCDATMKEELKRIDDTLLRASSGLKKLEVLATNLTESENTALAVSKRFSMEQTALASAYLINIFCAFMLLGRCVHHYTSLPWVALGDCVFLIDDLPLCLGGLACSMFSKLLHGKERLCAGDAVHILLWQAALLISLYKDRVSVPLALTALALGCLELILAFRQRRSLGVTSSVIRRFSLEQSTSSRCSEADSEAVSSVSASCQKEQFSPFSEARAVAIENISGAGRSSARGSVCGKLVETAGKEMEKEEVNRLRKVLGDVCIGPYSSESGYSTGRSSVSGHNFFGPIEGLKLKADIPFPRPLISPARLNVVSFSPNAVASTPVRTQQQNHCNIFLDQESRPLSMFPSAKDGGLNLNSANKWCTTQYRTQKYREPAKPFSHLSDQKAFVSKAFSEVNFSVDAFKNSRAASWWRDSVSDINIRDKTFSTVDNLKLDQKSCKPVTVTKFDRTYPLFSKLKISGSARKENIQYVAEKQHAEKGVQNSEFSDDEEEDERFPKHSSVSVDCLQLRQGWSWVQWTAVVVLIISLAINLFLVWTVVWFR